MDLRVEKTRRSIINGFLELRARKPLEKIRVRELCEKAQIKLSTPTGGIMGEKPMWVDSGEASTVENTVEYFPGLFACGMSANNVAGGYRMGPIFGGMMLSGEKVASLIIKSLGK